MTLKHIFMGMMMAAATMVGFTSCSDDDEPQAPDQGETEKIDLVLASETQRVKIGPENRAKIEVAQGNGEYHAYSLNPDIADVVEGTDGFYYIEGFKNGTAALVVSDADNNYKRLLVSVYTTDVLKLSHDKLSFVTPLGFSGKTTECSVLEGNGGYTIESDNKKVSATIDAETGAIVLEATSTKQEYTAIVKINDCTGLSAVMNVTVTPTFDAFTDDDLNTLMTKTTNDWYIKSRLFNYTRCSELPRYEDDGEWNDSDNGDGTWTFGWWENMGYDYGGHYITFPSNTAVGAEVDAVYDFKYAGYTQKFSLPGKAKIIKDDEESKVVVWWRIDLENECIERGWIVKVKSDNGGDDDDDDDDWGDDDDDW